MKRSILTIAVIVSIVATGVVMARAEEPVQQSSSQPPAAAALNLNTATQAELEKLPGVGAATAKQIIEYRQKNNGFKKVEELMNIKGIGEKSFLKLKPLVVVAPPKTTQR